MTDIDYKDLYSQLTEHLRELQSRRAELEANLGDLVKEIEELEKTTNHLAPLAGLIFDDENNLAGLGITEAVYQSLDAKQRQSVSEIKSKMEQGGFDFSSYSAATSSIHTILKRLVDGGKAEVEKEGWKTFYKAKSLIRYKNTTPQITEQTDEDIPF